MDNLFVGRQPILDHKLNLYAFELLYREGQTNAFPEIDPESATIKVIVNTYLSPGFEQIAAKKTFINFSEKLLMSSIFDTLNPNQVVIEILENVKMTRSLLERLKELKSLGFDLALDDFILEKELTEFPELFKIINYIKVDFMLTTKAERFAIEALKTKYPHIKLLAEKIETKEEFEDAKAQGYELFQGYYFAKPEIVQGTSLPTDVPVYFQVLKLLNDEDVRIDKVVEIVTRDVSLTYKLLKHANKHAYQSLEKISSVRQAIVRMGLKEFKRWILFLIVYQKDIDEPDGWMKTLVNYSLVRANVCEQLALKKKKTNFDEYYMLGMFSMFDLILKKSPTDVFPQLPVSEKIIVTLSGGESEMQLYLKIAKALEEFDYPLALAEAKLLGLSSEELGELAMKSAGI